MSEIDPQLGVYADRLTGMSDDELFKEWRAADLAGDEDKLALVEGNATFRLGGGGQQRYAARYPEQTRYQFPAKRGT